MGVRGIARLIGVSVLVMMMSLVGQGSAFADPAIIETDTPAALIGVDPCTGEALLVTGTIHSKAKVQISLDNHILTSDEENFMGVKAVGVVSGAAYTLTFASAEHESGDFDGAPFDHTWAEHFIANRQGEMGPLPDDFYMHLTTHTTMNAQGTPTSQQINFTAECK